MAKQHLTWDFTLYEDIDDYNKVRDKLKEHCKKWSFQLEKGEETGKLHYQGRMTMKTKTTIVGLNKLFGYKEWHVSITSTENKDNDYYTCKQDTRINGPWKDTDKDDYIPRDIRNIKELRPWQKELLTLMTTEHDREIYVIYDTTGNIGKTIFTRWMMCNNIAEILPCVNDCKDIMRLAYDIGPKGCYMFDMPRAMNKDRLFQLYSAIETLKGGFCYDDRYKYNRRLFDPPNICIFTNKEPDREMLSRDRWNVFIVENNHLKEYQSDNDFLGATL